MSNKENFMGWENPGRALITGASSGIGTAFAKQLGEQGFDLVLVARRKDRLEALGEELQDRYSINVDVQVADLSKIEGNYSVVEAIRKMDNLDVLICNAGYGILKPYLETDLHHHIDMINVHTTSPVMLNHTAVPGMADRKRGVIINTSSMSAMLKDVPPGMYTITKSAVTVLSELLQEQVEENGILVQALCPGHTYSEFHDVDSMKGFPRDSFPEEAWMKAEECVSLSLKAFKAEPYEVIFIPGEYHQKRAKDSRKATVEKYLNATRL